MIFQSQRPVLTSVTVLISSSFSVFFLLPPSLLLLLTQLPGRLSHGIIGVPSLSLSTHPPTNPHTHTHVRMHTYTHLKMINRFNLVNCPPRTRGQTFTSWRTPLSNHNFITSSQLLLEKKTH